MLSLEDATPEQLEIPAGRHFDPRAIFKRVPVTSVAAFGDGIFLADVLQLLHADRQDFDFADRFLAAPRRSWADIANAPSDTAISIVDGSDKRWLAHFASVPLHNVAGFLIAARLGLRASDHLIHRMLKNQCMPHVISLA